MPRMPRERSLSISEDGIPAPLSSTQSSTPPAAPALRRADSLTHEAVLSAAWPALSSRLISTCSILPTFMGTGGKSSATSTSKRLTILRTCLESALELNRLMIEHYWDAEGGGFFFTARRAPIRKPRSLGFCIRPRARAAAAWTLGSVSAPGVSSPGSTIRPTKTVSGPWMCRPSR